MAVKLINHLPKIAAGVKLAGANWLEETSGELEAVTKRNSVSASGQTAGSWKHEVMSGGKEAVVGSSHENAIWEEYGTGEYAAEGGGRSGPWYVPVEAVGSGKKPSYHGKVIIVYGKGGQAFYKTNGKKPRMMLHDAWDTVIPKAEKKLITMLKKSTK